MTITLPNGKELSVPADLSFRAAKRLVERGDATTTHVVIRVRTNLAGPAYAKGYLAGDVVKCPHQGIPIDKAFALVEEGTADLIFDAPASVEAAPYQPHIDAGNNGATDEEGRAVVATPELSYGIHDRIFVR